MCSAYRVCRVTSWNFERTPPDRSFIEKAQRITAWQTKTKHNFIETSISDLFFPVFLFSFSTWTVLFNGRRLLRQQSSRPYIRRLFLFFLPPRFALFIFLFYRIAVSWLSSSVSMWSLGQHVCRFSPAIVHLSSFWCLGNLQNHPVSLKIYASLLIANSKSVLNIKS